MTPNVYAEIIKPEECMLLLVDLQKSMLDLCVERERVCRNASVLIDTAALFDIPIYFSEHNPGKLGGFLPDLLSRVESPRVFEKLEFSCLENEGIARELMATGRRTLILAGIESHVCIFHTAAHALRLGYRVHVASDGVSSRSELNRDIGLRRLDRAGAVISSTEMILFELLTRAGTDRFRAALPFIKTL